VLTYGAHVREICGREEETDDVRVKLLAVVQALECLKRPVSAQVLVCSDALRDGVTRRRGYWPDRQVARELHADLWQRLEAAIGRHEIEWVWTVNEHSAHWHHRAMELADGMLGEEGDDEVEDEYEEDEDGWDEEEDNESEEDFDTPQSARSTATGREMSLDAALTRFLADRRAQCSARTFRMYDDVIGLLRWSISWYGDGDPSTMPASELPDQLPDFHETLVHKQFASPKELKDANTVLRALTKWLAAQGQLGAESAGSLIDETKAQFDEFTAIRRFVDAVRAYVEDDAPDVDLGELPEDDRVTDEYLQIAAVTDESITFEDYGDLIIGPITLPPEITELARPGWQILLTAARLEGEWRLLEVVNGDLY
jgi:ribonuclease HI